MNTEQPPRRVTELDLKELKEAKASAAFKRSNAHDKHNDAKAAMTVTKTDVDFWDKEYARLESELAASTTRYHQELADRLSEQDGLSQSERGKLSPVERMAAASNADKGLAPSIEIGDVVTTKEAGGFRMFVIGKYSLLTNPPQTEFDCEWDLPADGEGDGLVHTARGRFKPADLVFLARLPKHFKSEDVFAGRTERVKINDPAANVPRRKYRDLDPAEQEAAQMIDGDVNPRWKMPDGELVDSDLPDGKQPDKAFVDDVLRRETRAKIDEEIDEEDEGPGPGHVID